MKVAVDRRAMLDQIGFWNVGAISGGRVQGIDDGIRLPVGRGYSVEILYDYGQDLYTVKRVYTRGQVRKEAVKTGIFGEVLGEVAYRASCFENVDFGELVRVEY